jgi:hypothetical protein
MAAAPRKPEEFPDSTDPSASDRASDNRELPTENPTHGMEREPEANLGEQIRARLDRPHKGDVGRPGTNEEIFQGSKMKELK